MTLLELLHRKTNGNYRKQGTRYTGPCPSCGGSDSTNKFVIKDGADTGHCFACGWNGDSVKFLREFEGLSCGAAHAQLGKKCDSTTCPKLATCKQGDGVAPRRSHAATPAPPAPHRDTFTAAAAQEPLGIWQQHAEKLVTYAHEQLLTNSDQLDYLASRGLPLDYVRQHRLGWLGKDEYRVRSAWGLPDEFKGDGTPKKLWFPQGIVIPTYIDGVIHRVRIRKYKLTSKDDSRYYWVPGSGNDVVVINPTAQAFVIVEADLDGHLINHVAGDLVGSIALGTCSAHPKEAAFQTLSNSLAILVALDFDPGQDKQGNYKNPGGKSSRWWTEQFPQARRWPVIGAKDPGDAFKAGIDLRAWIISGLPPAMTIETAKAQDIVKNSTQTTTSYDNIFTIRAADGRELYITDNREEYARLVAAGLIVFNSRELALVKLAATTKEQAARFLDLKQVFPGASIQQVLEQKPE